MNHLLGMHVYLSKGLIGQDSQWELLENIWESRLQFTTTETSSPGLDLLTFSQCVEYFGVIFGSEKGLPQPAPNMNSIHQTIDPESDVRSWESTESPSGVILGLIYLASANPHLHRTAEFNIGIAVLPEFEGHGHAQTALELLLHHAFDELQCHRIQALLIDNWGKERALRLFTKMKFVHEGVRRRCFWSEVDQQWKDLTCLAMLDTDWALRTIWLPAPNSLWDELFSRHQRERDDLLSMEERRNRSGFKRTSSMETVIPAARVKAPVPVSPEASKPEARKSPYTNRKEENSTSFCINESGGHKSSLFSSYTDSETEETRSYEERIRFISASIVWAQPARAGDPDGAPNTGPTEAKLDLPAQVSSKSETLVESTLPTVPTESTYNDSPQVSVSSLSKILSKPFPLSAPSPATPASVAVTTDTITPLNGTRSRRSNSTSSAATSVASASSFVSISNVSLTPGTPSDVSLSDVDSDFEQMQSSASTSDWDSDWDDEQGVLEYF